MPYLCTNTILYAVPNTCWQSMVSHYQRMTPKLPPAHRLARNVLPGSTRGKAPRVREAGAQQMALITIRLLFVVTAPLSHSGNWLIQSNFPSASLGFRAAAVRALKSLNFFRWT